MTGDDAAELNTAARLLRLTALDDAESVQAEVHRVGEDAVIAAARRYRITAMLRDAIRDDRGGAWASPGAWPTAAELVGAYAELAAALDRAGVDVLLMKGPALGTLLYADPDRRLQFDVDVLVRDRQKREARRIAEQLGYERSRRDGHSISYRRGRIGLDLHHAFRTSPGYAIDSDAIWRRATTRTVCGVDVRTLADLDTLTLLTISLAEDLAFGMAKLKNVCDIWLLGRVLDASTNWPGWLSECRSQHVGAIVADMLRLSLLTMAPEVPGAEDDVPRLRSALEQAGGGGTVRTPSEAEFLLTRPRGSQEGMRWFATVSPSAVWRFRAHALVTGLPHTLLDLRPVRAIRSRRH